MVNCATQDLRSSVLVMASEDQDDDDDEAEAILTSTTCARLAAEQQLRVWSSEPGRRDDILPYFVWSIVHDEERAPVDLKAFLEVKHVLFIEDFPLLFSSVGKVLYILGLSSVLWLSSVPQSMADTSRRELLISTSTGMPCVIHSMGGYDQ